VLDPIKRSKNCIKLQLTFDPNPLSAANFSAATTRAGQNRGPAAKILQTAEHGPRLYTCNIEFYIFTALN